jgi:isoleucyl-tRNA synthetase
MTGPQTSASPTEAPRQPYPAVDPNPSFPKLEEEILAFWKRERIFEQSVERRPAKRDGESNEFVFYDGPPFANGLPHYGHLVTGFVKDIVPRYQTMRGHKVERRFGWDCHGLPAELQAESELGISGRPAILEYGIERFNTHCRKSVLQFTEEWQKYVTRQARWVDFEHDYKTLDLTYMESVMWAIKTLWDKGLLYEGYRVMPYSWAIQSPLSNFETRLDNSYRDRQDPAVTVAFTLDPRPGETKPLKLLVWTTTPWTLPSNLAIAVGPDIDYAIYEEGETRYLIGEAAAARYEKQLANAVHVDRLKGRDLVGRSYKPLFPFFADTPKAFRVLAGDFVTTEDGTGIVHMAPGFGEDDLETCVANGIPVLVPVGNDGRFTAEVPPYEGQLVFDANKQIIQDLKKMGALIRHDTILHSYPHCWRTDTPLIYRAINAWFLKVTAFRDRMVEVNKGINWIPTHVRDGLFGNWLEGARDWNISRNRFWGSPIPVWKSDDPRYPRTDVYGSLDELERDFGVRPKDLHRPGIDQLVRPNPDDPTGQSMMRRVEDVLDCWFESGSMPFAQVHYPFENKEWFEGHFPGDFIVEYVGQTRGWFYTLVVLSTALFDRAPFRNCVCHGIVLDENHQKLSKRLRNYPDPLEVFDTYGADALRWYLVSSPLLVGGDLALPKDGRAIGEVQRQVLKPIWNAYYFFTLYANADGITAEYRTDAEGVLDRYILAKTRELVEDMQRRLDGYDIPGACAVVARFIDALNNWYIRRSRERFWRAERDRDKIEAYNTLYTVLTTLIRAIAPLAPYLSEAVYRSLTGETSVHFAEWPEVGGFPAERELVETMDSVREICSAALSIREARNLRVRLPLARMTVATPDAARLEPYRYLIEDEINVKQVEFSTDLSKFGTLDLHVNPKIGARIGRAMKEVLAAAKSGGWKQNPDGTVTVAGQTLAGEDFSLRLRVPEGLAAQSLRGEGAVILNVTVTPELKEEGLARDLVRLVQMTRKEAGLHVADRIELGVSLPAGLAPAIERHRRFICAETLALDLRLSADRADAFRMEHQLEGQPVTIEVRRASAAR